MAYPVIGSDKNKNEGVGLRLFIRWAILLSPLYIILFAIKPYWSKQGIINLLITIGSISLLTTLLFGYAVGRRRLWKKRIIQEAFAGTVIVMLCYIFSMSIFNPSDPSANNAAALEFFIFAIPVAVALALVLSIGAGIGHITLPTQVIDPKGKSWAVRLQLIPNREGIGLYERFMGRLNKRKERENLAKNQERERVNWLDVIFNAPDSIDDLKFLLIILAAAVWFYFIGWPLLLLLFDLIWLVIVLLGAIASFVILRRPITITAACEDQVGVEKVQGLIKAYKKKQEIVQSLLKGTLPKQSKAIPE